MRRACLPRSDRRRDRRSGALALDSRTTATPPERDRGNVLLHCSREMAAAVRLSLRVHCAERQPGHRGCRSLRTACSALRLRKREAGPSGSSSAEDPPSAAWCPPGKAEWEFTVTVVEGLVVSVATSTLSGCIVSRNSARLDGVVREAALEPAERAPGLRSRAPRELGAARAGEDARADVVDERSLDAH